MTSTNLPIPSSLAVALGANLPSTVGPPRSTLQTVRPKIELIIQEWLALWLDERKFINQTSKGLRWRWSPLFETDPIGGPPGQPNYVNAVVIVDGPKLAELKPSESAALALLKRFINLENDFGRSRQSNSIRWGPRTLDIDILAWGSLHVQNELLILPHPRLIERSFVVIPLAAALTTSEKSPRKLDPNILWPN